MLDFLSKLERRHTRFPFAVENIMSVRIFEKHPGVVHIGYQKRAVDINDCVERFGMGLHNIKTTSTRLKKKRKSWSIYFTIEIYTTQHKIFALIYDLKEKR